MKRKLCWWNKCSSLFDKTRIAYSDLCDCSVVIARSVEDWWSTKSHDHHSVKWKYMQSTWSRAANKQLFIWAKSHTHISLSVFNFGETVYHDFSSPQLKVSARAIIKCTHTHTHTHTNTTNERTNERTNEETKTKKVNPQSTPKTTPPKTTTRRRGVCQRDA